MSTLLKCRVYSCTVLLYLNTNDGCSIRLCSAELELKEAEVRQLRVQTGGGGDAAGNVYGSGRLVQLEAELKMARVRDGTATRSTYTVLYCTSFIENLLHLEYECCTFCARACAYCCYPC